MAISWPIIMFCELGYLSHFNKNIFNNNFQICCMMRTLFNWKLKKMRLFRTLSVSLIPRAFDAKAADFWKTCQNRKKYFSHSVFNFISAFQLSRFDAKSLSHLICFQSIRYFKDILSGNGCTIEWRTQCNIPWELKSDKTSRFVLDDIRTRIMPDRHIHVSL